MFGKPVELNRNQAGAGFPPDALTRIFQVDPVEVPGLRHRHHDARRTHDLPRVEGRSTRRGATTRGSSSRGSRMGDQLGREFVNAYLASPHARAAT